jgi:hypothetical protein
MGPHRHAKPTLCHFQQLSWFFCIGWSVCLGKVVHFGLPAVQRDLLTSQQAFGLTPIWLLAKGSAQAVSCIVWLWARRVDAKLRLVLPSRQATRIDCLVSWLGTAFGARIGQRQQFSKRKQ